MEIQESVAVIGLLGTIVGAFIAALVGYYQAKRIQEQQFRKDLSDAIRAAYSGFLKEAFTGSRQTEHDMQKYLQKMRAAFAPVFLLGSREVRENIEYVLNESARILAEPEPENDRIMRIDTMMSKNINILCDAMNRHITDWDNYLKR
jgi:hypothetical protein